MTQAGCCGKNSDANGYANRTHPSRTMRRIAMPITRVAPLIFWLLAGLAVPAAHATTSAKINHTEVFSGETIQLQIETDQDGGEPDLTILEPLFSVTGRSESSQISMVNGAVTRKRAWTIGLRAKQEGRVTIPAISV